MAYFERVKSSFSGFWHNMSLLAVMLLEFVARMILVVLFMLIDLAIVGYMNKDAFAAMTAQNFNFTPLLNAPTIIVTILFILIELFVLLYVNSFFSAGFYGMAKNYVKDGATSFGEFMPSVKRYWTAMFRFLFLRYGLTLIFIIPLSLAIMSVLETTPGFVDNTQWAILIIAFVIALVCGIVIYFWLFYGEAAIVFEDLDMSDAVKRSWRISKSNKGVTIGALATVILIVILASAITSAIMLPFDYMVVQTGGAQGWSITRDILDLVLNVIAVSAMVISTLFIFLTYNQVVGKRPAAKPVKEQVKVALKRKSKK